MNRTVIFVTLMFIFTACSSGNGGPTPDVLTVTPDTICTALGPNTIEISGSGFSPIVEGGNIEPPSVVMPEVWLVPPEGEATLVPPAGVTLSSEGATDTFHAVIPQNLVPPIGADDPQIVYDIRVDNPNGKSGTLEDCLTVVPPTYHDLLGIEPPFGWTGARTNVTIFGDGWFISTPTAYMRLSDEPEAEPVHFESVAFIDENTLTAIVPGGAPIGTYDVTVVNPPSSDATGFLVEGFQVVSQPVPIVVAIVPGRGTSQDDTDVSIYGQNFRDPVRIELINSDMETAVTIDGVTPVSEDQIDTTFPTATQSGDLPAGPYLVRVWNMDEETYYTYSSFLVTNPAGNLNVFEETEPLSTGRRMPGGTFANDVNGNRYLYAIGGDTGDGGTTLDTVELCQLSNFGVLGAWREQGNSLNVPRRAPFVVSVPVFDDSISQFIPQKNYLYVIGGLSDTEDVLSSVERAVVLSPENAPVITNISSAPLTSGLAAGTWYYKVSAVLSDGVVDNPDGETLASEEAIITLDNPGSVSITWEPVTVEGESAVAYRIYRTDEADGTSQQEHLIAETTGTSYEDGGDAPGTASPLFAGATGAWVLDDTNLVTGRWGHGSVLARDASGNKYIYTMGGKSSFAGGVLDTVEAAAIDSDGDLGAFEDTSTVSMNEARAFFGALMESTENVSTFPDTGSRLWVMGGIGTDGEPISSLEESDISVGGENDAWITNGKTVQSAAGVMPVITNNKLFCLGGAADADDTTFSNITPSGRDTEFDDQGDISGSINSTASSLLEPRALGIGLQGAGFIYFYGGTSDGTDAVSTCERTF